jgi:ribonuclease HII
VDPTDAMDPLLPIDRIEPVEPIDSSDPVEPMDKTEAVEPTDRRLKADIAERADATHPMLRWESADHREFFDRQEFSMGAPYRWLARATVPAMAATAPQLRRSIKGKAPGLRLEQGLWDAGCDIVAGIDEVGRGSWAGPLTLAAVVVPREKRLYKVRDSKMLTESEREVMHDRVVNWVDYVGVGHATQEECDELGMSAAQKLAAQRALGELDVVVDHVLVDGNWDFVETHPTTKIVRGDAISLSIAAASIVAKVTRDRMMREWDAHHPAYGFAGNKGYPCPRHKAALAAYGPSAVHRRRWAFMDDLRWTALSRVGQDEEAQLGLF